MAVLATRVYCLRAGNFRDHCIKCGLDSSRTVRLLRRRLVDNINRAKMNGTQDQPDVQASVPTELVSNGAGPVPPFEVYTAHDAGEDGQAVVLVELLRQISPLRSEEPVEIMRLFVRLEEIYDLGLVIDREFIMRIMPLVGGSMLRFLGGLPA